MNYTTFFGCEQELEEINDMSYAIYLLSMGCGLPFQSPSLCK